MSKSWFLIAAVLVSCSLSEPPSKRAPVEPASELTPVSSADIDVVPTETAPTAMPAVVSPRVVRPKLQPTLPKLRMKPMVLQKTKVKVPGTINKRRHLDKVTDPR